MVGNNALDSTVNHFEIKPGKHIEVLNLNNGTAGVGASHQYFHVIGATRDQELDFGTLGSGELQYRPAKPAPVRVAVFDEEASRDLKEAQLELADESLQQDSSVYQWVYRPEMMYSVYELEIEGITREFDGQSIDIFNSSIPTITVDDESVDIAQQLSRSCLLYTSPSPRDRQKSRMPSSA